MSEHDHEHGPGEEHEHGDELEDEPVREQDTPAPTWFDTALTTTCPACGAPGAMSLGEGIFCPTCGEVSTPRGPVELGESDP
jgi:hypothetical protein